MSVARIIGWSRDRYGKVTKRPMRLVCPAVTSFVGGGPLNTTPIVVNFNV